MPRFPHSKSPLWMAIFGLLLGLSAPGFNQWWLAWVALIPALLWCRKQSGLKQVIAGGFLFGFAFNAIYCLWFFDLHPLTWLGFDPISSRLVTLAGWLLIATEGGLLVAVLLALYSKINQRWARLIAFPLLWVLGFGLLNITPLALPWALLEYTQASLWPMRLLAGWLTGSGITALLVLHNTLWAETLTNVNLKTEQANRWLMATLTMPLMVLGLKLLPNLEPPPAAYPMPVAVVQANLPIELIRSGQLRASTIDAAYLTPIRQQAFPPNTLIVYPEEGVAPGLVDPQAPEQNPHFKALQQLASQQRLYIAVGISSVTLKKRLYNSIALISPDNQPVQVYHKRRLVPFGEFTPYGMGDALTQWLAAWGIAYAAPYDSGKQTALLNAGNARLGGLVCFELIDSAPGGQGFAAAYKRQGATLMINSSNLGWFHENPLLEAQFLAIGQLRSAETLLPLVIASNTGISAILSNTGKILKKTTPSTINQHKSEIIFYNGK